MYVDLGHFGLKVGLELKCKKASPSEMLFIPPFFKIIFNKVFMANHKTVMWEVLIFTFYCTGVEVSCCRFFFMYFV